VVNTPTGQVGPPESAHARRAQPGAAIELTTLTDGGQPAPQIAAEIATFLNHARTSLDLALYDVRLETEAGALVLATLLAAHQRGLRVRLLYNVDHPGPIPVPPPPETRPEAIEALPVETRGIAGIPDLMHHKFCVRDRRDVWTGSMNWTEDSWTRQENVVVRVLGAERLAFAFSLAFEELWQRGAVEGTGTVEPRPVELPDGSSVRPWFTPGHGEALSHRVAKHIGRARRRIRIASPVLTAGPILGTLVEVVNERRCTVVGVVDDTQVDEVFRQWSRNQVSAWKIPLLHTIVERGAFSGKPSTPWAPDGIQDFMHAKVVVCDDVSFVGSFNFSRSGERNAENVVEIHDAATADALARYVEDVKERYPQATPPDVRADAGELAAVDVRQPVDNAGP
jgi:phosphatidylserine/phosphatidylglycerophosphate/cardiolipin synthase-like enzyme